MARKFRKPTLSPATIKAAEAKSWAVAGIDISMATISGAMLIYDSVLDKMRGPGVFSVRWEKPVHFLDRLGQASRAHDFMLDLMHAAAPITLPTQNVWIGVEEPWPAGIVKRAESMWLRQQAQIQGAFMGGLARYGFTHVYEVNAQNWRKRVADDLGVKVNRDFTKFIVKEWAMDAYGIEDRPDLIRHNTRGLIAKPDTSKAKPVQPDDIYDACGLLAWMDDTRMSELDEV